MLIFRKAQQLSDHIVKQRNRGRRIGFVPTMGALHHGHLTLIHSALSAGTYTICSIFVNPTQFNNPEDFKHYPVTLDSDLQQLLAAGCDALFLPSVDEIYPPGHIKQHYAIGSLETVLEGKYRPGHFQGVCEVVDRLLQITEPDELFMGQKDFQQCMVVNRLLQLTGRTETTRLRIIPTIRETDGLAMSSRNLRLTPEQRSKAPAIFQALSRIKAQLPAAGHSSLESRATLELEQAGFTVDYVSIARAEDLSPASSPNGQLVALVAASIGPVRLIDNLPLN